jgi:hypothetical protein
VHDPKTSAESHDQIDGIQHVAYEIWMSVANLRTMAQSRDRYLAGRLDAEALVMLGAAIESGPVHARTLTEFFLPGKDRDVRVDTMSPVPGPRLTGLCRPCTPDAV